MGNVALDRVALHGLITAGYFLPSTSSDNTVLKPAGPLRARRKIAAGNRHADRSHPLAVDDARDLISGTQTARC